MYNLKAYVVVRAELESKEYDWSVFLPTGKYPCGTEGKFRPLSHLEPHTDEIDFSSLMGKKEAEKLCDRFNAVDFYKVSSLSVEQLEQRNPRKRHVIVAITFQGAASWIWPNLEMEMETGGKKCQE